MATTGKIQSIFSGYYLLVMILIHFYLKIKNEDRL